MVKRVPGNPGRGKGYKFKWVRWATGDDSPLSTSQRHACHVLAMYADEDGTNCYPGEDRIARAMDMTGRSVRRHLAVLRDVGAIERVFLSTAPGMSNVYDLTLRGWYPTGHHARDTGHESQLAAADRGHERPDQAATMTEPADIGDATTGQDLHDPWTPAAAYQALTNPPPIITTHSPITPVENINLANELLARIERAEGIEDLHRLRGANQTAFEDEVLLATWSARCTELIIEMKNLPPSFFS